MPQNVLERIIGAALKVPNNDHMRDWHYIIIQKKNAAMKLLDIIPKDINRLHINKRACPDAASSFY